MKNLKELIPIKSLSKKIIKEGIEDLDVNLPTNVERFLDKLAVQIKQYNLPRKKETLVIARIIDAMGMDKNDVMRAISKIKQAGVIGQKKNDVVEAAKVDMDDYADQFQRYIEKKYDGKLIGGWKLDVDTMSGGFQFDKKGSDLTVLATPFWEGKETIQIDTVDSEGDYNEIKTIPFKYTGDMKKEEVAYIAAVKKFLQSFQG